MFPVTENIAINNAEITKEATGGSFLFDFELGDFVVQDGKVVIASEYEALKVWIEKILRTEKNRYKIYEETAYGCQLEDLIVGSNYPVSFIESELKREIEDALLQHPKISSISNFSLERGIDNVTVSLEVVLIDSRANTYSLTI